MEYRQLQQNQQLAGAEESHPTSAYAFLFFFFFLSFSFFFFASFSLIPWAIIRNSSLVRSNLNLQL